MKDLTQGNEAKQIFFFALPMLIGNVFQQLYSTVDSVIVGNALGKDALAAVGASFPVMFLLIALVMGVTMGSTILIAQYYGAKDMQRVKKAIDTTYIVLFFASIILTVVGLLISGPVLKLLNTPDNIYPMAKGYLDIIFAGMIVLFGYNSISAILRGLGDSKTPLYFLIISTVINIVLDLVFVLVFNWGVAGAAWATVIAQGCSFAFGIYHLNKTNEVLRFRLKGLEFDRDIFKLSLKIGLPSGVQQMLVATGMMALTRIVNGFGTDALAAYTAGGRIDSFAAMPAMNLSVAVSTFVGQNMGAKKPERVKHGYKATLLMASVISLFTTFFTVFFGKELISIFNTDPNVIQIGYRYLTIIGVFYILFSTMFVTNGVIRGAGETMVPMFITVLSLWGIRVPTSAILSTKMGTDGIWWGVAIAWCVGMGMSLLYYKSGRWKNKVLVGKVILDGE